MSTPKLRNIVFILIAIPVFVILVWFFAIPDELLQERIEDLISTAGGARISASLKGLRKGLFFDIYAEGLALEMDGRPAIEIRDLWGSFNPLSLAKRELSFSMKGKIGTGEINGSFSFPRGGDMTIEEVELNAISYLTSLGIRINGHLSASLALQNDTMHVIFQVPDLDMGNSELAIIIPFVDSFNKLQGILTIRGNNVKVKSVTLEGERARARISGDITNGYSNLTLELMPSVKLNSVESMLIGKYQVSPGYYVIPLKGQIFR